MQTELTEQVIVIWILTILILISLIILVILTILIKITLIKAGVMRRLRSSQDPWEQLGVARGANREEVLTIIIILNVIILLIVFLLQTMTIQVNRVYRKMAVLLHPDKTEVNLFGCDS